MLGNFWILIRKIKYFDNTKSLQLVDQSEFLAANYRTYFRCFQQKTNLLKQYVIQRIAPQRAKESMCRYAVRKNTYIFPPNCPHTLSPTTMKVAPQTVTATTTCKRSMSHNLSSTLGNNSKQQLLPCNSRF